MSGAGKAIDGGMDVTHLSAAAADQAHREQREDDARRYLTRKGHTDLLPILGLAPDTTAPKRRRPAGGTR